MRTRARAGSWRRNWPYRLSVFSSITSIRLAASFRFRSRFHSSIQALAAISIPRQTSVTGRSSSGLASSSRRNSSRSSGVRVVEGHDLHWRFLERAVEVAVGARPLHADMLARETHGLVVLDLNVIVIHPSNAEGQLSRLRRFISIRRLGFE